MTHVWMKVGDRVRYWAGAKSGEPTGEATIIGDEVLFGRTPSFRVRKDNGASDYIATTHLVPAPSEHRVIPAMRNGVLRHPPICVNCGQPIECPGAEWQHVSEP